MRRAWVCVAGGLIVASLSLTACKSSSTTTANPPATTATAAGTTAAPSSTGAATPTATQTAASSDGGTVDVCALMTSAQASSINKVTYGATKSGRIQAGFDTCTYTNSGKHDDPVDIQNLNVKVISISGCYAQLQSADGPGKSVPGVGDAAFGYSIGLITKVGDRCVDVEGLTHNELQDNYAPDVAMTKIIIGNLG